MEIAIQNYDSQIIEENNVIKAGRRNFIEANTIEVSLEHLKNECTIPVFAKDNETTISHFQFITTAKNVIQEILGYKDDLTPDIRASHVIKGRIPQAVGKPANELLDHEKTIYYERMAFVIEIPEISEIINGNKLNLCVGGVRAYNQENLFSKKSIEKFKVFIGFQNTVCTNLCISTDGIKDDLRVSSIHELGEKIHLLINQYDKKIHLKKMQRMNDFFINEIQFAHLIGKMKLYNYLEKDLKRALFPLAINDTQINSIVRDYHFDSNFSKLTDDRISLWNVYNLFTEANKSTYIDSNFERNLNAYEFINHLVDLLERSEPNYFIHYNKIAFSS